MAPPLIYIAGPFRAATPWEVEQNVRTAEEMGLLVARCGGLPVIPHCIGRFFNGHPLGDGGAAADAKFWVDGMLGLLRRCDGAVFLRGWKESEGCRLEHAWAEGEMPIIEANIAALILEGCVDDFVKRVVRERMPREVTGRSFLLPSEGALWKSGSGISVWVQHRRLRFTMCTPASLLEIDTADIPDFAKWLTGLDVVASPEPPTEDVVTYTEKDFTRISGIIRKAIAGSSAPGEMTELEHAYAAWLWGVRGGNVSVSVAAVWAPGTKTWRAELRCVDPRTEEVDVLAATPQCRSKKEALAVLCRQVPQASTPSKESPRVSGE